MRYRLIRILVGLLTFLQMRLYISHQDAIPADGPVLLVSNHLGMTDPLVIALPVDRQVRILAKAELFDLPLIGWLSRQAGVIPVRRGTADREALQLAYAQLAEHECVLIFPEGKYQHPPELPGMQQLKTGAAWLALKSGAQIVPVAIWGTEYVWELSRGWRPWNRPPVHVVFGEPYYPQALSSGMPTKALLNLVAAEMAEKIADLLPPPYHGVYAHQTLDAPVS
jgi:1-acyl-sn-glycerol-3-phosphate acyltransferase